MTKKKVAILGATGLVGQRMISLLYNHPQFEISAVCASERSIGKRYKEVTEWRMPVPIPPAVGDMVVKPCEPKGVDADIVLSSLPAQNALEIEPMFAKEGYPVDSKASSFRMEDDVPLIVPEINADHLGLIDIQKKKRKWDGFIVTDPNCTTIGFSLPLAVIYRTYGLDYSFMTSMQALSGMGLPGYSFDLRDNVIPFIKGEEEKVEKEILKILGKFNGKEIEKANFSMFASCNRVNVIDGHLESLFCKTRQVVDLAELKDLLSKMPAVNTPTSPKHPIIVRPEEDRPQPKLDRDAEKGMAVTVGRLKQYDETLIRFHVLSHNAIRGAAGAGVVDAELLVQKKYV
jgi:aspartate-semialdehyde dehydrogenase